jgi:hypothetical protein
MRRKWRESSCEKQMDFRHKEIISWRNKQRIHSLPIPQKSPELFIALASVEG